MPHFPLITSDCTWHVELQRQCYQARLFQNNQPTALGLNCTEPQHAYIWKQQLASSIPLFHPITNAIHLLVTRHTDTHEADESEKAE